MQNYYHFFSSHFHWRKRIRLPQLKVLGIILCENFYNLFPCPCIIHVLFHHFRNFLFILGRVMNFFMNFNSFMSFFLFLVIFSLSNIYLCEHFLLHLHNNAFFSFDSFDLSFLWIVLFSNFALLNALVSNIMFCFTLGQMDSKLFNAGQV